MRKTSQDGGDSTSITSGIENEIKKTGAIIKTKRNSMKRKVQNFSHESDDAVIEPLLQKDKEKTDTSNQSAKYNLSKAKTEPSSESGSGKDKLTPDSKLQTAAFSDASENIDKMLPTSKMKENTMSKMTSANAPLHNHMNTNVFSSHDSLKGLVAPKTQLLVEIDGSKQVGYSPSPLIFTTAKIHTDGKTKHMEPVQMTPVPILSTIEVNVLKRGINKGESSGHVSSNISTMYANIPTNIKSNTTEQDSLLMANNTSTTPEIADAKNLIPKETISNKCTINNVKNDVLENKCFGNKEEYHTRVSSSHSMNSSTLQQIKTIQSVINSGPDQVPVIMTTSTINSTKKTGGILDQTVSTTKDNYYTAKHREKKTDLNKKCKHDNQLSESPDDIKFQKEVSNSSDKTGIDKSIANTSRQSQQQAIVTEKCNNSISKLKQSIVSTTLSSDAKCLNKSDECQKKSIIVGNTISDTTKMPKSSANNVPLSKAVTQSTVTILVDNTIAKTNSVPKISAVNKPSVSISTSGSIVGKKSSLIATTADNKIATSLTGSTETKNKFNTANITSVTNISSTSGIPTIGAVRSFPSITTTAVGNKLPAFTTPIATSVSTTTTISANKITASSSNIVSISKTPASSNAAAIKKSPPSTITVVDNTLPQNVISSVKSTSSNIPKTKSAVVSITKDFGSVKSAPNVAPVTSQVTSTINDKITNSTMSSSSSKVSTSPSATTKFNPTTAVRSPAITNAESVNNKTITPTTVISDKSLTRSMSPKSSSAKNNSTSINSMPAISGSLTSASSGSSSKIQHHQATNQSYTKSDEMNNGKKSSKA